MSKPINTNFTCLKPAPIDSRTQVSTYAGLALIPVVYNGLKVYVADEDKEYRYYTGTGWVIWSGGSGGSGAAVWGSITGTLTDQTDLLTQLNLKFAKAGGTITGAVLVQSTVTATDFLISGSAPSTGNPYMEVVSPPATASSTGVANQVAYDGSYFYICIATDTWLRAPIATW